MNRWYLLHARGTDGKTQRVCLPSTIKVQRRCDELQPKLDVLHDRPTPADGIVPTRATHWRCESGTLIAMHGDKPIGGGDGVPHVVRPMAIEATVAGARVLVEVPDLKWGAIWLEATVVSDSDRVRLADGRVLPGSTRAAIVRDQCRGALPKVPFRLSALGYAWSDEDGTAELLIKEPLTGAITELGQLLHGEQPILIETNSGSWELAQVA